jgi:archaellum component FlaC
MILKVSCPRKPIVGPDELRVSLPPGDSAKDKIMELLDAHTVRFVRADPTDDGGGTTLVFAISTCEETGSTAEMVDDQAVNLAIDYGTLKHAFFQLKDALQLEDVDEFKSEVKRIVSETLEDLEGTGS